MIKGPKSAGLYRAKKAPCTPAASIKYISLNLLITVATVWTHNVLVRYDFFADLNLTPGISSNSFYWFLCDVGARPISYFFQFWSFGGAMGPQTGSKEPQIAQNRHSVP